MNESPMMCQQRAGWLALCLFVIAQLAGCSVDEFRNKQRMSAAKCKDMHGTLILGKFCVPGSDAGKPASDSGTDAGDQHDAGAQHDAGSDAGMSVDASMPTDAGGNTSDAGQREACATEGDAQSCYTGKDINESRQLPCKAGVRTCHKGFWGTCEDEVLPGPDVCNGMDDDCDGNTDEGLSGQPCSVSDPAVKGVCTQGISLCRQGSLDCVRYQMPATETCNGVDDDCDGMVDEDTGLKCYPAGPGCTKDNNGVYTCVGACSLGTQACVNGTRASECSGAVTPQPTEACTNSGADAVDENCNGQVDEGCTCQNGATAKCYTGMPISSAGVGVCKKGDRLCTSGSFGACMGDVTPQPETCANEGTDDDCNGIKDDVPMKGASCADVSTGKGVCKSAATWQCKAGNLVCVDGTKGTEVCDSSGADENCDGQVNETFNLQTDPNNCGSCGNQCASGTTCCSGNCVNTASSHANCGQCGHACATASSCCSSTCKNVQSDGSNCGSCGKTCLLGCSNGSCNLL